MSDAYKKAGVDLQAGYEVVARIKKHMERTRRIGAFGAWGGFGGMFDLGEMGVEHPVLVAGADGVGTKILIAFLTGKHDTVGIDAVAMCVNDVLVQGAEPLFFLDYIACGANDPERIETIVSGIAEGCIRAGCALLGGETAEMPGLYGPEEYDLAGFAVGVCEKEQLIDGSQIEEGDILLGLASSGLHSNGYSLVRRVLLQDNEISLDAYVNELGCTWAEELLRPTRIYVQALLPLIKAQKIKGLAHITGGGFVENIPRMLPRGLGAAVKLNSWERPPVFALLEQLGSLSPQEMFNIFNMGIGMVLTVSPEQADSTAAHLRGRGESVWEIGQVQPGEGVRLL